MHCFDFDWISYFEPSQVTERLQEAVLAARDDPADATARELSAVASSLYDVDEGLTLPFVKFRALNNVNFRVFTSDVF